MTDGEKALGLLIALMGAELGAEQIRQYGCKGDTSPEKIFTDDGVMSILDLKDGDAQ